MSKTVLITGGTRGIGKATALLFAKKGWNVAFTYLKNNILAETLCNEIKKFGVGALAIKCDVSNPNDCNNAILSACEKFGEIEALVNNAGISQIKLVIDMTDSDWKNMFDINTNGVFYMSRACIPHMLNRNCAIVNVTSMWGRCGASCEAHYSAAKAAVIGFTQALAKELGPSGIRVNAIAPGVIKTDMNAHLSNEDIKELEDATPLCRIGEANEVAHAIYFLASEDSSFITGQILGVDGGYVIG